MDKHVMYWLNICYDGSKWLIPIAAINVIADVIFYHKRSLNDALLFGALVVISLITKGILERAP